MASEQTLLKKFLVEFSRLGGRLFRNNTGKAYAGVAARQPDGSVHIKNPRVFHGGLCVGSSDLIGWSSILVTPEMVGRRVAVFTASEIKSSRKMKPTREQKAFIAAVNEAGGIGIVAYELKDLLMGVSNYAGGNCTNEGLSQSKVGKVDPLQ